MYLFSWAFKKIKFNSIYNILKDFKHYELHFNLNFKIYWSKKNWNDLHMRANVLYVIFCRVIIMNASRLSSQFLIKKDIMFKV